MCFKFMENKEIDLPLLELIRSLMSIRDADTILIESMESQKMTNPAASGRGINP
jgi:hypothetical protein